MALYRWITRAARLEWLFFALPLAFLGFFFFFPLTAMLRLSLESGRGFGALTADPYYSEVVWFSAWQAALSTALTLALALPAAFVFARYHFPGKGLSTLR